MELRGIEPLTYSMRTSRATNCAIAPDTGCIGYQPERRQLKPARLLSCSSRQIVSAGEGHVFEVFEDWILIIDVQDN